MILDSEDQRKIILNALMNVPIQGDYQGIVSMMPAFTGVVEAVKQAEVKPQTKSNLTFLPEQRSGL